MVSIFLSEILLGVPPPLGVPPSGIPPGSLLEVSGFCFKIKIFDAISWTALVLFKGQVISETNFGVFMFNFQKTNETFVTISVLASNVGKIKNK